jgi:hypothetical protein
LTELQKELADKDKTLIEMKKELIDFKAKANAKVDTNLEEARKLAAKDAEKKAAKRTVSVEKKPDPKPAVVP